MRDAVREQIESLGAKFLDLGVKGEETAGGYAAELTPEQQAQQQAELEKRLPDYDAVITTAAIPGRPAPKLIPASAVKAMRPGSVIVDLAAETGGNCELTQPGEEVVRDGVTIVGRLNLPSEMPYHASQLYARNVQALLNHLAPEGELVLDFEDEITAGACVTRKEARRVNPGFLIELTVLILAAFLGVQVISKVPTLLHTPLMSGTNAIHGIVIVGAIIVAGAAGPADLAADRLARRGRARHRQRGRRLRRHRPDARDVQAEEEGAAPEEAEGRVSRTDWIYLAYLVTIVCFIVALQYLSHPAKARNGN